MAYTTVNNLGQVFDQGQRVFSARNLPSWSNITNKPAVVIDGDSVAALSVQTFNVNTMMRFAFASNVGPTFQPVSAEKLKLTGKLTVFNGDLDAIETQGGIIAARNVSAYSDSRLKQNIQPLSNAMDVCRRLKGYTYQFIAHPDVDCIGVIAQDVQQVLPQLVSKHRNILSVEYTGLIPVLIEAIKSLDSRLLALESR